jgi:hypothetical protein
MERIMPRQATAISTASPYLTKREAAADLRRSIRSIDRMHLPRINKDCIILFRGSLDEAMKAKEIVL